MNLPNKLTLLRIALTPVFLFLFFAEFVPHNHVFALIVFIIASVTDALDGKIARKNGIITNFGKIADPIADKILTTTVILCFMQIDLCSVWVILITLAREFTVSAIRIVAASQGEIIPANIYGKIKTVFQMVSSILILLAVVIESYGVNLGDFTVISSNILMWIMAILTVISGVVYIRDSAKVIDFNK